MDFRYAMTEVLNNEFNTSITENGAQGYRTTGIALLDLNFTVSSLRNASDKVIEEKFAKAYYENQVMAVKWLFYSSDVRYGLGERRLFRVCLTYLSNNCPKVVSSIITLIPEYNRWDNAWVLLKTQHKEEVIGLIKNQLEDDIINMNDNKSISLLAKWMKSINTSSKESRSLGKIMCNGLHMTESQYRKTLSKLRAYLKIVEINMSAKKWSEIDYNAVTSRANLIYNNAFLRNDELRRREFLAALERGDKDVKINSAVLYPHDIVHQYVRSGYSNRLSDIDITLEQLWKGLPNVIDGTNNVMVVADGSGSMTQKVGGGSVVMALSVAQALAIYFSERSEGQFKDYYITFSSRPQLVDLSNAKSLRDKLDIANRHSEVANTNIESTFKLILQTAKSKAMKQEELPKTILILSDMEFDSATSGRLDKRLFQEIEEEFKSAGYLLPRLVFWNICGRTNTIPVKENQLGVALVSGFSLNICKMVLSNELDPFKCLEEQLNSERYQPVEDAILPVFCKGW